MSISRTRKNKRTLRDRKNPHYGFLVSWEPKDVKKGDVKGESKIDKIKTAASTRHDKNADYLAQAAASATTKKRILRSLIVIGFILILELVVYLAWNKFIIK